MLQSRRTPPVPFFPADNQWTRGLVFFSILDGTGTLRNYARPGAGLSSSPPNQETVAGIQGYAGLNFNAGNGERIVWDQESILPLPSVAGGSGTVIARVKPTTGSGTAGCFFGTFRLTPANGFMLYFADVGSADEGLSFIVGEANATLFSHSGTRANYSGYEYTAGGRYDNNTRTTSVWQNGVKLDEDSDLGTAWLTTPTVFLRSGDIANSGNFYDGNIYWVACFDRALTDSEMRVWGTIDPLELICPEDPVLFALDIWSCGTTLGVATSWQDRSTWSVGTNLTADAQSGGSVPSTVPPSVVWACSTDVGIPTATVVVSGILFPAAGSSIAVSTSCSISNIWACESDIAVSSAITEGVNGKTNVLAAGRYRR